MSAYLTGIDILGAPLVDEGLRADDPEWRARVAREAAALGDFGRWEWSPIGGFWHWREAAGAMNSAPVHAMRRAFPGMAPLFDLGRKRSVVGAPLDPRAAAVAAMQSWLGVPYLWGGGDPAKGLDCSGAVLAAWKAAGILPANAKRYTADGLYRATRRIIEAELRPGDLVFYGSPDRVTHVMMATGDGRVLGATGGGPSTTTVEKAREQGASVQYKLTGYRRDVAGFGAAPVGETLGSGVPWWTWVAGAVGLAGLGAVGAWLGARGRSTPSSAGARP